MTKLQLWANNPELYYVRQSTSQPASQSDTFVRVIIERHRVNERRIEATTADICERSVIDAVTPAISLSTPLFPTS